MSLRAENVVCSEFMAALSEKFIDALACSAIADHGEDEATLRRGNVVVVDDRSAAVEGAGFEVDEVSYVYPELSQ